MALNFDVSKIANNEEVCNRKGIASRMEDPEGNYWAYATESIAWNSLVVNLSGITEENYRKWYERYVMFSLATGRGDDLYLSLEDVRKHIGFKVNVSDMTDARFLKFIAEKVRQRAIDRILEDEKKASEAGE